MATVKQDNDNMINEGLPSYVKVRDWLVDYIAGQRLGPGDKIPSERVLAGSLGLSRPTIARALSRLVEQGVLMRGPGRTGTFINGAAPSRSFARTRTIGMIMPGISIAPSGRTSVMSRPSKYADHFEQENITSEIMHGVLSVVKEAGCRLVVHHNNSREEENEIMRHLANEHLDGAVVMPDFYLDDHAYAEKPAPNSPPIVFVDRYIRDMGVDWVVTDNFAGAKSAVDALIAKGHKRIAFFTDFTDTSSVNDREAGYRAALEEAGIPVEESLICGPNNMRRQEWSFEYALYYCTQRPDPITAVFGINDNALWAIFHAANTLGLSVPGDLEIAGFFDTPVPMGIQTSFLRVVQRKYEIGQTAARLLLERISGEAPAEPRHILVPADLVMGS